VHSDREKRDEKDRENHQEKEKKVPFDPGTEKTAQRRTHKPRISGVKYDEIQNNKQILKK
jgi:hypothetical protein